MRSIHVLLIALVCVLLLAGGCDYPEQGFFMLTGLDSQGKVVERHVFEVEELVDDTDLTYGFTIHVYDPAKKTVVDLPFDNVPEFTRRGWLLGLRDSDYGAGDIALDLTHDDKMSFVGAWRSGRGAQAWPLAGRVLEPQDGLSTVEFSLPLPAGGKVSAWRVEPLSDKQVAERLGKLSTYKRIAGGTPEGLDAQLGRRELEADARRSGQPIVTAAPEEQKRYTPPPLGGKRN